MALVTIVLLAVDDADEAVDRCLRFPLCVLICLFKWSERENGFWQILQLNGLIPVCDRTCLANSSDLENRQEHSGHVQGKGFSPVCRRKWALR